MRPFHLPGPVPLAEQDGASFTALVALMQRLLAPDGCPWDREQDAASLRKYVLEEACEVIDAIDGGRPEELVDELGDLSLQVVFLAELARKEGTFGPDDVARAICEKLVRRHPHVFGDESVSGATEVLENWEAIKQREKVDRPLLGGIARSLPALERSRRIGETVAGVGFDWPDQRGPRGKINEELGELDEAIASGDRARIASELGDVLFSLVNLARHHGVSPEDALRGTADRFTARFAHVEKRVRATRGDWPRTAKGKATLGVPLETLDTFYDEAKGNEP
jgi:tetrapyrrole methylase family protein/MazG family protein/ATP diphosphatase